jgi:hypothetical protein
MKTVTRVVISALLLALAAAGSTRIAGRPTEAAPTCSTTLGIAVHGQHVLGDYVSGIGHGSLDWPPSGADVGEVTSANGGPAFAGGPGPGFHFLYGIAPGASFCLDQSRSPGIHFGP